MYLIEVINDYDQFLSYAEQWNHLLEKSKVDNIFLTHEWLKCWWEAYGKKNNKLFILFVKDRGELIGIAPLMISKTYFQYIPVNKIGFIENFHTGRMDFIIYKNKKEVIDCIFNYLNEKINLWDVGIFNKISTDSENYYSLQEVLSKKNIPHKILDSLFSPYIKISTSSEWETFLGKEVRKLKKTMRNNINRLKRLGEMEIFEINKNSNNTKIEDVLMEISAIGTKSWKNKSKSELFSTPNDQKFYSTLAYVMNKKGYLNIWLLKVNTKPIAFEYHLIYKNKSYALKASYDLDYSNCSPGSILEYEVIKNAFNKNYFEIDLLGQKDQYKMKWNPLIRKHIQLILFSSNLKAKLLSSIELRILPFLKNTLSTKKDSYTQIN